jgi:glycosyltransferase involved in cell wall biosynthesis
MPAFNAEKYIAEAIKSVLEQTYSNLELIIIDDGSTDSTAAIVESFHDTRIQLLRKANGGAASARNEGLRNARGEYIMFLDADDKIVPWYIYRHLVSFEQHPQASLIYCDHKLIDEHNRAARILRQPEYTDRRNLIRDMFRCAFPVISPIGLIKRKVFEITGFLDESLLIGEDYDLMRRFILHSFSAVRLPKALYLRRILSESLSRTETPQKAAAHFTAIQRWTETFTAEELFPDVDWSRIPLNRRKNFLQTLIGATYRTIGKNYAQSRGRICAAMAFDLACGALRESLKSDYGNKQTKILLDQCENEKQQLNIHEMAVSGTN